MITARHTCMCKPRGMKRYLIFTARAVRPSCLKITASLPKRWRGLPTGSLLILPRFARNGGRFMGFTKAEFTAANHRGKEMQAAFPPAIAVRYDRRIARVVVTLASGLQIAFAPRDVPGLMQARPADLADAEISPSGLGVHFPRIDADIYLPGLLKVRAFSAS